MIRNLKALGLALLAVFAMSAVAASGAQAEGEFTADEYPASVHAEQVGAEPHAFTIAGGRKFACEETTFSGVLSGPSSTLTIAAEYEKCHAIILGNTFPVTVTMNSCDYNFHVETKHETHLYTGDATVECDPEDHILIHVYKPGTPPAGHSNPENQVCTYTIGPQTTGANSIAFINMTNEAGAADDTVTVKPNVSGISYTRTFGGLATCGPGSGSATYEGNTTTSGENEGEEAIGVRVSG